MKFNKEITEILEKYYKEHEIPNESGVLPLAEKCGLTPQQVKSWFRNKINRQMRKAKRIEHKTLFEIRVRCCEIRVKKLKRWLDTAKRYMNDDLSDTSSDSSWEHTRSEDEEEDDADPLTLAGESAHADLLGSAAELAKHGYEKDKKKDDLVDDGPSTSAKALHGNQWTDQELFSFVDDDKPSTSKAAAATAKALYGDHHSLSGSFEQEASSNLLSYLDDIPSTSKAAAATRALYNDSINEMTTCNSLLDEIPPIILDDEQTILETGAYMEVSNIDEIVFLEDLTSSSFGNVETTLGTEGQVDLEEFLLNDDEPSTSEAAAARFLQRAQQLLENEPTNLDGSLMCIEDELPDSDQEIFYFLDDDIPTTSEQGIKAEPSESSKETETPVVPIQEEENKENILYEMIYVSNTVTTQQINIPLGPEDVISISSAAEVEEIAEVSYSYNQQHLEPVTLPDFNNENDESTTEENVVYLVRYGNFNPEG